MSLTVNIQENSTTRRMQEWNMIRSASAKNKIDWIFSGTKIERLQEKTAEIKKQSIDEIKQCKKIIIISWFGGLALGLFNNIMVHDFTNLGGFVLAIFIWMVFSVGFTIEIRLLKRKLKLIEEKGAYHLFEDLYKKDSPQYIRYARFKQYINDGNPVFESDENITLDEEGFIKTSDPIDYIV